MYPLSKPYPSIIGRNVDIGQAKKAEIRTYSPMTSDPNILTGIINPLTAA